MATNYICNICQKDITDTEEDLRTDESGEYHYDCYEEESLAEQRYWAKRFPPKPYTAHVAYDARDAYEINDPKHPDFLDWADDQYDIARGK